jgi:hypothetical protein
MDQEQQKPPAAAAAAAEEEEENLPDIFTVGDNIVLVRDPKGTYEEEILFPLSPLLLLALSPPLGPLPPAPAVPLRGAVSLYF